MTQEQVRGRNITLIVAALVAIPAILQLTLALVAGLPLQLYQIVLSVLFSFLLYKGYGWVKGYLLLSFILGGLLFLGVGAIGLLSAHLLSAGLSFLFGAIYIVSFVMLLSKPVSSYFDQQAQVRDGVISLMK